MARTGVTEAQVHAAADALVLDGERPTIERLRAHLGTGSPNTLLRGLDTWWVALGRRLTQQQESLSLPDAPDGVVAAASALWKEALAQAQRLADAALGDARTGLAAEQASLEAMRAALHAERLELGAARDAAKAAEQRITTQLEENRASLLEARKALDDLRSERDRCGADAEAAQAKALELDQRLQEHQAAAAAERAHLLTSEARWAAEVDRLRQQLKMIEKERTAERRENREAARLTAAELKESLRAKAEAERAAAAAKAVVLTLEARIDRMMKAPPAAARRVPVRPKIASAKKIRP